MSACYYGYDSTNKIGTLRTWQGSVSGLDLDQQFSWDLNDDSSFVQISMTLYHFEVSTTFFMISTQMKTVGLRQYVIGLNSDLLQVFARLSGHR